MVPSLTRERGALKSGLKLERHYYQSVHRGSWDTMTDHSFEIGDTVVDREDPSAVPAVVVALPARTAGEWLMYGGITVAWANPGYPADAPIVVVVAATDVGRYLPDWDAEMSLPRTALDETGIYYTAIPAPRLTTAEPGELSGIDADALPNPA